MVLGRPNLPQNKRQRFKLKEIRVKASPKSNTFTTESRELSMRQWNRQYLSCYSPAATKSRFFSQERNGTSALSRLTAGILRLTHNFGRAVTYMSNQFAP